jgi:hypothetical protein
MIHPYNNHNPKENIKCSANKYSKIVWNVDKLVWWATLSYALV